jgi:hypothetical protein
MQWDAIQQEAKAKGILIYAIDQAQTPPLTQPGPWGNVRGGYCLGLAASWVALAYQGKDFPFSSHVCDNPPWQATMAQTLYANATKQDRVDDMKNALAPFSCTVSPLRARRPHTPSAAFLCQVAYNAYGCYGVILEGPISAHAVVMRNGRDGRMHLFDPNYFHLAAKNLNLFQSTVDWWLSATGYRSRYTTVTTVFGIRPPINHTHQ